MRVRYLTLEEVLFFHSAAISEYGGTHGIRDLTVIQSAVMRPRQAFRGRELYPDVWLKSAALFHSLAMNHGFVDGNKRVALISMSVFLKHNGWKLTASTDALFDFVLQVVNDHLKVDKIAQWFKRNCKKL